MLLRLLCDGITGTLDLHAVRGPIAVVTQGLPLDPLVPSVRHSSFARLGRITPAHLVILGLLTFVCLSCIGSMGVSGRLEQLVHQGRHTESLWWL